MVIIKEKMTNSWSHILKCDDLMLFPFIYIFVNGILKGFGLLFRQSKQCEDDELGSKKLGWAFLNIQIYF